MSLSLSSSSPSQAVSRPDGLLAVPEPGGAGAGALQGGESLPWAPAPHGPVKPSKPRTTALVGRR